MRIKLGKLDIAVHALCLISMVVTCLFLAVRWGQIPDQVPNRFSAAGEILGMADKGALLLLPLLCWVLYLGLTALEQFPQLWSTGVRVTAENQERVYRVLGQLLCIVKLAMVIVFCGQTAWSSTGLPMPGWGLPAVLLLILGPTVFFLVRLVLVSRPRR